MTIYGAPVPANAGALPGREILLCNRPGKAIITAGPISDRAEQVSTCRTRTTGMVAAVNCELSPLPTGAMIRDLSGGLGTFVAREGRSAAQETGDRVRSDNRPCSSKHSEESTMGARGRWQLAMAVFSIGGGSSFDASRSRGPRGPDESSTTALHGAD